MEVRGAGGRVFIAPFFADGAVVGADTGGSLAAGATSDCPLLCDGGTGTGRLGRIEP